MPSGYGRRVSSLVFLPAADHPELLAAPVAAAIDRLPADVAARIEVAAVDAALADTVAFCEAYGQSLDISANCLVVQGSRGADIRTAACLAVATTRLDVNGVVRKLLDARKATFAPMDAAVVETGMQYGGITPLGIPSEWRLLLDAGWPHYRGPSSAPGSVAQSCSCRARYSHPFPRQRSSTDSPNRLRERRRRSAGQSPSDARRRRVTSAAGMRRGKAATMRSSPAASSPSGCTP